MHCTLLTTEQEKRIEITAALNYCVTGLHHATHCEEPAETLPCKSATDSAVQTDAEYQQSAALSNCHRTAKKWLPQHCESISPNVKLRGAALLRRPA